MMNFKKTLIALVVIISMGGVARAQEATGLKALQEKLEGLDQSNKAFNFYLNMQNSANVYFNGGDYQGVDFKTNQLRLEMRGEVVKGVRYRLRHRMNRGTSAQGLDNLSRATDIASISIDVNDQFTITGGKQCTAFGGYEFDLNPIDIYQYSDMIDYMDNFLTGVDFAYQINDQELRLQIVNSRNNHLEELYNNLPEDIESSKNPLGYTFNWNGKLLDGKIQTRWSYSIFEEAKDNYMHYVALGTQFKIGEKAQLQFDWMNSHEDLDRKGIVTTMLNEDVVARDVIYNSLIAKMDYRVNKKFNLFVKGMYETASCEGDKNMTLSDDLRASYGYSGGLEYFPVKDNLKIFCTYVGRYYNFDSTVNQTIGLNDENTHRFSIGLVYRLKMF